MEIILNKNTERYEVAKAGGWSLADGKRISSVVNYIQSNPDIHFVVPSAPGVVDEGDAKITDLLISCCQSRKNHQSFTDSFVNISKRFTNIAVYWGYSGLEQLLDCIEQGLKEGGSDEWVISRGEWANGKILADILGFRFVDPTELIKFRKSGQFDRRSYSLINNRLRGGDRFVIPGFYGLGIDGGIRLFPRDGSDVTGAIIARGVNASLYRNLTNTDGVLSADPAIVKDPKVIETLTFEEYRELGNGGVKVLHRDTIVPVANAGIPINVRHSERPTGKGSMVVVERPGKEDEDVIGIAGKSGFISLNIHKYGMNDEIGIESRILQILRRYGISIEHVPSGADHMSIIFSEKQLKGRGEDIKEEIGYRVKPDRMQYERNLGLLSIVGQGINSPDSRICQRLFSALDNEMILHKGYTRGVSGISITIIVDNDQINKAVQVTHDAFIKDRK